MTERLQARALAPEHMNHPRAATKILRLTAQPPAGDGPAGEPRIFRSTYTRPLNLTTEFHTGLLSPR